jgi:hypothetical protein
MHFSLADEFCFADEFVRSGMTKLSILERRQDGIWVCDDPIAHKPLNAEVFVPERSKAGAVIPPLVQVKN